MEQFEFSFSPQENTGAANDSPKENLEALSDNELAERYHKRVGVNPQPRGFDRATLLTGLADPQAELDRIRALDDEDDKREIRKTYAR